MISPQDYEEFNRRLHSFLAQRLPQGADVEDITQDVLLKLHENISNIREPSKVLPWIFKVARHQISDFYRQKYPGRQFGEQLGEGLDHLQGEDPREEELNFNEEFSHCMLPMIEHLPPIYAKALKSVEVEGLSQKEFAKQEGLSYSGAKSRLQRGRRMIQEAMSRCCQVQTDSYGNIVNADFKKINKMSKNC